MTRDEILDIRIRAAKAMGWGQVESLWKENPDEGFIEDSFEVDGYYVRIDGAQWRPDTDLTQAIQLGRKFGRVGFYDHPEGGCVARVFVNKGGRLKAYRKIAYAPALAITLAALKVAEGGEW